MLLLTRFLCLGTLAALCAFGQETNNAGPPVHQPADLTGQVLDGSEAAIPNATVTLENVSTQARIQTLTQADGSFVFTAVAAGRYSLQVARPTFAQYRQIVNIPDSALRVHLRPADLNQSVTVSARTGYVASESSVATRLTTPLGDIPQDVQVVNRTLMDQRLDFQLADAARTVSGVSRTNTGSGYLGNSFAMRGFTLDGANSYLRDGLKFGTYSFSDLADVEEVDVLKGPASVLFGAAEPGGVINLVSKKPLDSPIVSLEFTGANGNFYRPEFDISGPMLRGHVLDYRLIGSYQQDFQFRDYVTGSHYFLAPSLSWHPNSTTTLSVFGEIVNGKATSDFGIPVIGNRPAPVPISRYYGEPWNLAEAFPRYVNYSFHHSFTPKWSIENRFSFWSAGSNYLEAYPSGVAAGSAGIATVKRLLDSYRFPEDSKYSQTEVAGSFNTGPIQHTILIGFEAGWRNSWFLGANANAPSQDALNPVYGSISRAQALQQLFNPAAPGYGTYNNDTSLQNQSGYVQDQFSVGRHWKFLVGGRFENYPQQYHDFLSQTLSKSADFATSPRAGLVFQPRQNTSLYFSYVRSFNPVSPSSHSLDGTPFKPSRGQQYEAGWKQSALGGRLTSTVAAYWITKSNILTPNPINPVFSIQTGMQRSKGIDLDIMGRIATGWNAWFAYAFTQAQVSEDNTYPIGNLLLNAPRHTGNLWTTYEVPGGRLKGIGFGGGVYASSFKEGNLGNTFIVPGYARVDGALYYTFHANDRTDWRFSLNVKNALDHPYYEAGRGSFARPGARFAAYSSVKFTWH